MSKNIRLTLREALLQILQNSFREMTKVKSESIPELLVRVKRSTGLKIEE
jgi:hypothetical protein